MTKRIKTLVSLVLAVIFVFSPLLLVSVKLDHDCAGEECEICEIISICSKTAKMAVLFVLAVFLCGVSAIKINFNKKSGETLLTPIRLKVKMTN
ncbi:MAG: hypothetical protein IKF53_04760 [Clostridia bacterium]|nr:hypothetical protein [Clostridia bacterium]